MSDERLLAIGRLVESASREFGLRPPDALAVRPDKPRKWYGLATKTKKGRFRIQLRSPAHDAIPALTLAHELAHIHHWKHGDAHDVLTVEILDHWQRACPADLRAIG